MEIKRVCHTGKVNTRNLARKGADIVLVWPYRDLVSVFTNKSWHQTTVSEGFLFLGSGNSYAYRAWLCGIDIKEAIRYAMLQDKHTGGEVQEFNLMRLFNEDIE